MKQTKTFLGIVAIVLLSAGVALSRMTICAWLHTMEQMHNLLI